MRAECERLRASEAMYRLSAELGGRLVWSISTEGEVLSVSRSAMSLSGVQGTAALTSPWMDFVHPEDRGWVERAFRHSLATGTPYYAEFRVVHKDGSVRWTLSQGIPDRDEEGRILRWFGTTEDVHEARERERALREMEERYRLASEATNDAVWDYDIIEGQVDWSGIALGIFDIDRPRGRTSIHWWQDRVHPDDKMRVLQSLEEAIADPGVRRWSAAYRFMRADGDYADVFDRGSIIRGEDGRALRAVGAIVDLTERHRAEAEIRRMQDELIHVSRVSAMGTMASTLAHEINQPLTAVTNFIRGARNIVERGGEAGPGLADALAAAEGGALRAGEIIRRLRELIARGTATVSPQPLPRLIEEAGTLAFLDEARLGVSHRYDLDPAVKWVSADRVQIQQVLINLIRNAIEAMQDSSVRELVISTHGIDADTAEIRIADTGRGIPSEIMDSLFSHFMTTKLEGMGIGLSISRTIVEAHGGKIAAENRPEGGAVFSFTLPRARRGGATAAPDRVSTGD